MAKSDAELVHEALGGSQSAYREIVLRYQRPVFSLIVRMVRDAPQAEDLAQEVFVKMVRALESYDRRHKFSSWLFKIAHNATIDYLRKTQPLSVPLETPGDERLDPIDTLAGPRTASPDARAESKGIGEAITAAVGQLRPEYREVVLLRFQEGLSYEEISGITELPLGTVKTHIYRARKALMKVLTEQGWGPR